MLEVPRGHPVERLIQGVDQLRRTFRRLAIRTRWNAQKIDGREILRRQHLDGNDGGRGQSLLDDFAAIIGTRLRTDAATRSVRRFRGDIQDAGRL